MAEVRLPLVRLADGEWLIREDSSISDVLRHLVYEQSGPVEDAKRHLVDLIDTMEV